MKNQEKIDHLLYNAKQTAEALNVSLSYLYSLHNFCKLPSPWRLGRRTLWPVDELRLWINDGYKSRVEWQMRAMAKGFVKLILSKETEQLLRDDSNAFLLLSVIALRANRDKETNSIGLEQGEAMVGDYRNYGMPDNWDCFITKALEARVKGKPQTITGITNANPCVVTVPGHGLSNGDHVYITGVGGMTELDGNYYTADDTSTTEIKLREYIKYT